MTIDVQNGVAASKRRSQHKKTWNDRNMHSRMLGCQSCIDLHTCGGLSVKESAFDCLDYCCEKPERCDVVCKVSTNRFVERVREIDGFSLSNVRRAQPLNIAAIPKVVPLLYHGSRRDVLFSNEMICLPLYHFIFSVANNLASLDRKEVCEIYRINPDSRLMLTGVAEDWELEKWWAESGRRVQTIRSLKHLGIEFVTSPNFSVFADRPRWDDMHSMKRIAIAYEEFSREGIRTALHVNARTERDYDRWAQFVSSRQEISDVAFEFRTGARYSERIDWHVQHLCEIAKSANRLLNITVRAAPIPVLQQLSREFNRVTIIESNSFIKTMKRRRGVLRPNGSVKWVRHPTERDQTLDALLNENWGISREGIETQLCNPN